MGTDLTIGRLTAEKMIDRDGKVMRDRDHGFLVAAMPLQSMVARREGGVRGATGREGGLCQGGAQPTVPLTRFP